MGTSLRISIHYLEGRVLGETHLEARALGETHLEVRVLGETGKQCDRRLVEVGGGAALEEQRVHARETAPLQLLL